MEKIRRKLLADQRFQAPNAQRARPLDIISIESSSSEASRPAPLPAQKPIRHSKAIIVSSDEEEDNVQVVGSPALAPPSQPGAHSQGDVIQPGFLAASRANADPSSSSKHSSEEIKIPDFQADYRIYTSEETEKELRDLMGNSMNQDIEADVDMADAIVPGFKEEIRLLPHQIVGRAWMKDRETGKKAGGILADDMGLGKTIQTLTRIVEGKPHQSDRDAGWSGCTLVVCPLSVLSQWAAEVEKMTTKLRVVKHQGPNRTTDPSVLRRSHVIVTTYDTVKSEYDVFCPPAKDESNAKAKKAKRTSNSSDSDSDSDDLGKKFRKRGKKTPKRCALFGIKWWRVVLDEAHTIKNVKTKGAIACCELDAKFRWCLTGTPMQNNVSELQSLLKFLRIKPYSNLIRFNEDIGKLISSGRGAGRAMKRLQYILKSVMLRRRKEDTLNGKALIELPARTVEIVSCSFDAHEKSFYEALESKMEVVLDKLLAQSKGGGNYMSVLLLLLRLRQACNHPLLVSQDFTKDSEAIEPTVAKDKAEGEDPDDLVAAFGQLGVTRQCQMCTATMDDRNSGKGEWKSFCLECVPLAKETRLAEIERPTSAKIRKIMEILKKVDKDSEAQEKTIIFSQFTSMLNLIEPFLNEERIKFVRYDGSMVAKDRDTALEKIKTSSTTRVILISFKAGSTGLNLTSCNNVILVDMWWNPALEEQAFDRAHRLGQKRDVNIYKLKIDGTVEDRILDLQSKKRALAHAALSGDKIKNMRLGMDDLLALFRPGRDEDDD